LQKADKLEDSQICAHNESKFTWSKPEIDSDFWRDNRKNANFQTGPTYMEHGTTYNSRVLGDNLTSLANHQTVSQVASVDSNKITDMHRPTIL